MNNSSGGLTARFFVLRAEVEGRVRLPAFSSNLQIYNQTPIPVQRRQTLLFVEFGEAPPP